MLAMLYPWEDLALSGSVAFEFVSDDHARHVSQSLEQLTEELLSRVLIPPTLHQDIENRAILIDRPPEVVSLAIDRAEHFVQMPLVAWSRAATAQCIGILLPKLPAPLADRFGRHEYATREQELLDVAVAEAEPVIQPDAMADDLGRKAVVLIAVGWG